MSRIVIIGGHGKVALHLARILTDQGDQVTSVIRNPDHADDIDATGAHPVVADIEHSDTSALADLLAGHDAVVFAAGAGGGDPARTYAVDRDAAIRVIDAAGQAGVRRFVIVSYFGAGPDHGVSPDNSFFAYAEAKSAADAHLRATRPGLDRARTRQPHAGPGNRTDSGRRRCRERFGLARGCRAGGRPSTARRLHDPTGPSTSTVVTCPYPKRWPPAAIASPAKRGAAGAATNRVTSASQSVCRSRRSRRSRHRAKHVRCAS